MSEKVFVELKICRSCLNCNNKLIEADDEVLKNFYFLIEKQNSSSGILPRTFCEKCLAKIKISSNFKKQSQESEKYLLNFLSKINLEFTKSISSFSRQTPQEEPEFEYLLQNDDNESEEKQVQDVSQSLQPTKISSPSYKEEPIKSTAKLSRSNSLTKINEKSPIKMIEKPKQQIVSIEKILESSSNSNSVAGHLDLNSSDLYMEDEQHIEDDDNIFDDKEMYEIMEMEGSSYVDEAGNPILESNDESGPEDEGEFILVNYKSEDLSSSTEKDQQFIVEEMYSSQAEDSKPFRKKHMKRMPKEIIERYAQSTDNNQHICTKCVKVFSTRTNLIRHIQSHDGNKPYVCEVCQKGFTQSGSLKQHMYIHSGQRPYKCTYCDRAFTQGKTLKFHLRKHMNEKPFICSECNSTFRQRDGLKRHLKTRHNIELKYERSNHLDEKIIAYVNMDDKSQSAEDKSEILEIIEESENK